jgi:hypothetical protein
VTIPASPGTGRLEPCDVLVDLAPVAADGADERDGDLARLLDRAHRLTMACSCGQATRRLVAAPDDPFDGFPAEAQALNGRLTASHVTKTHARVYDLERAIGSIEAGFRRCGPVARAVDLGEFARRRPRSSRFGRSWSTRREVEGCPVTVDPCGVMSSY